VRRRSGYRSETHLPKQMRVQFIEIIHWRHFEGIRLTPPDDAPVICLVGGNGTGKSQILELLAACAQRLGLSPGTESSRGDPFAEPAIFSIRFFIARGSVPAVDEMTGPLGAHIQVYSQWDRTLTIHRNQHGVTITAGGIDSSNYQSFAAAVVETLRQSAAVHYLSLDADRAYPKIQVPTHELGQAFERDWDATHKQSSFRITRNLYEEWFRFLIGKENQDNNRHIQKIRLARDSGSPEPFFVDQFENYKRSVRRVLPHLLFVGIDPQRREIRFDSTGIALSFDQLSGGEREIAFLIGQIERFALRKGLLLVDEPELHLNYDLLRSWIGFLKDSVEQGQIWLATHSLEVVEVTGQDATFLLQRNLETRRVDSAVPLSSQPVVSTLSRAIGSPAFSITNLAFVFVEGEEEIGERERFRLLTSIKPHVRFMEAGSCNDVIRRIDSLRALAEEAKQPIRLGGVVDGDWRSADERSALAAKGLFVLPVHEVENFFLHPGTLEELVRRMGGDPAEPVRLVLEMADKRAGSWILNAARTDKAFIDFPPPSKVTRELAHGLSWADLQDLEAQCAALASSDPSLTQEQSTLLTRHLVVRAKIYAKRRAADAWRICEGKEVFRSISRSLGFADYDAAERAIAALWTRAPETVPVELNQLREYINSV
jgi:predicted ATPase